MMLASGSTMERTKYRLEKYTIVKMAIPIRVHTPMDRNSCRSTAAIEVTNRITPTVVPW